MSFRPLVAVGRVLRAQHLSTLPRCARRQRSYATHALALANAAVKPSKFGQPLHPSHPHLLKEGEITPGITAVEYEHRRRSLMESLPDGSLVLSFAGDVKYMSGRAYKYRQASDFWYLTGFEEPEAVLVLQKKPSNERGYRAILFHRLPDPAQAIWDGARTSSGDIVNMFGLDEAKDVQQLPGVLTKLLSDAEHVYVDMPARNNRHRTQGLRSLFKYMGSAFTSQKGSMQDSVLDSLGALKPRPLAPEVGRLRSIKSTAEQQVMRAAADVSARAHYRTMRFVEPGMSEHDVAAYFEYVCARMGAQRPAYVPVVASGPNALAIHYTANNQLIRENEMILMDAACEYNGYASDITRTFPVSGKFTPAQRELYGAVLHAQKHLITLCTVHSGFSISQIHQKSVEFLRIELAAIGFTDFAQWDGAVGSKVQKQMGECYPHFVGHPVGIDLHESSHFDRHQPLKPGMVITIEPGLYIPPTPYFPTRFHNLGVRIEDQVLVGEHEPVVLTVNAPKEIDDVEAACQRLLPLQDEFRTDV
ncbi:uncharacterized protein LAESUDRAFT_690390 [Laetiporus sulphureus 93-53]|uniref:Aminopeptidase P N-terminal domain-containing protein n=1 Tax=Laetiporus sulphureus 93-53 TaxID=1314785 RepID=A0A165IJI9_9APHY|nr:uncharacterized protein LAESUDRAFT_690390 [Laetiporus sulphureus 93-53]KZT13168.1 hypothetical protein LAESUDRAFT_690390 [Laetiporus sulphureus 93-53]